METLSKLMQAKAERDLAGDLIVRALRQTADPELLTLLAVYDRATQGLRTAIEAHNVVIAAEMPQFERQGE